MQAMDFKGRWVVVTGASSGLGRELAIALARDYQANLVLTARRAAKLAELKEDLVQKYAIEAVVVCADMSDPASVESLYRAAVGSAEIYGVILNAGVTHFGRNSEIPWANFQAMLATNVTSVVRLSTLFTEYLVKTGRGGGIMTVSSLAGLMPIPYQAAYAGTKAFVTNYMQSIAAEMDGENISYTIFSPGGIDTEMVSGSNLNYFKDSMFMQSAADCANAGLAAFRRRDLVYVPGLINRGQLLLSQLMPRNIVGKISQFAFGKALAAQ